MNTKKNMLTTVMLIMQISEVQGQPCTACCPKRLISTTEPLWSNTVIHPLR
jgi:hypothetical protein